jgi:hypothetical protein
MVLRVRENIWYHDIVLEVFMPDSVLKANDARLGGHTAPSLFVHAADLVLHFDNDVKVLSHNYIDK